MECVRLQQAAWAGEQITESGRVHLESCDACRAEFHRASDILSSLHQLSEAVVEVPAGLEAGLISAIHNSPMQRARRIAADPRVRRVGVGVGVGAAAAAALAGIVVARRRTRASVAA